MEVLPPDRRAQKRSMYKGNIKRKEENSSQKYIIISFVTQSGFSKSALSVSLIILISRNVYISHLQSHYFLFTCRRRIQNFPFGELTFWQKRVSKRKNWVRLEGPFRNFFYVDPPLSFHTKQTSDNPFQLGSAKSEKKTSLSL